MFFEQEKFMRRAQELRNRRWGEMSPIDWFYVKEGGQDPNTVYTECPAPFTGDTIRLGDEFAGRDRYIWMEREVRVPEAKEGFSVMGYFDFGRTGGGGNSGFESLLYINGEPWQGVDSNHREVVLAPFAGQKIRLTFLLWSGLEGGGPVRTQYHRLGDAKIGYLDVALDELYYLSLAITEGLPHMGQDSADRIALTGLLDRTLAMLDWDSDRLPATGAEALTYLKDGLEKNAEEQRSHRLCHRTYPYRRILAVAVKAYPGKGTAFLFHGAAPDGGISGVSFFTDAAAAVQIYQKGQPCRL